jgi:hypothetical protein
MTVEKQVKSLQSMANPDLVRNIKITLVLIVAVNFGVAAYLHEFFFVFAGFLLVVGGLSCRNSYQHIINAAKGWRQGRAQSGTLNLSIDGSGDDAVYNGIVNHEAGQAWQIRFSEPQEWKPDAGKQTVKLYFIHDVAWPVLLVGEQGMLYPCKTPQLVGT